MIWVYAICDRPELGAPRRRGLAQAPLEAVREGALLAVVSAHRHSPADPALDALWVHERVVERLMGERTVLPMRFGTTTEDAESLRIALAARHEELLDAMARVRGRVELGVRAIPANGAAVAAPAAALEPAETPAPTGREYLLAKLGAGRRARDAVDALHEPLAARAVDSRRRAPSAGELLRAAYLVERADVSPFLAAVERLRRARPDTALLCTGPWPPYSFVGRAERPLAIESV